MNKIYLLLLVSILGIQQSQSCAWYDPEYEYFNLFTQSIIKNKAYAPFLLTYSTGFYENDKITLPDENIGEWQQYFEYNLTFNETKTLVYSIDIKDLNNLKFKRSVDHPILKKLGYSFYTKYQDAIDYLIEAKYLSPYMRITQKDSPDSFYTYQEDSKTVADLKYNKILRDLISLYNATDDAGIKLRYGYQIVRFQHYNREYSKAIEAFNLYVKPLKIKNAMYFMALEQMAGAQRGLGLYEDANWNFFQVFKNSKSRKIQAYTSMRLTNEVSFQDILNRAKSNEDRIMAYFLLAYQDFNNPLPMMKKIYEIDPTSDALIVLQARVINELERNILSTYCSQNSLGEDMSNLSKSNNRLPFSVDNKTKDYLAKVEFFTNKNRKASNDEFWDISLAYIKFLQRQYESSQDLLNSIQTNNTEYRLEINKMMMLNEIVCQPIINRAFEERMIASYPEFFLDSSNKENYQNPSTKGFIEDILANRYYLQNEHAKSFLMSNSLTMLKENPDFELVNAVENFYNKKDKTAFEKQILKNKIDLKNPQSYFSFMYGDYYARVGKFDKALKAYENVKDGEGFIPTEYTEWDNTQDVVVTKKITYEYDFFHNIPAYILGRNVWVSYSSPDAVTMKKEKFMNEFNFIPNRMNKVELMNVLLKLKQIGRQNTPKAAKANQLIGNMLYNTSKLGYYRHIFVFDINNINAGKFEFYDNQSNKNRFYYKDYYLDKQIESNTLSQASKFYQKALKQTDNKEQKAKILFQLAKIEQGEYYQWKANQPKIPYDYAGYEMYSKRKKKQEKEQILVKNNQYRTYFKTLKQNYLNTQAVEEIRNNCSYFDQFMMN